MRMLPTAVVRGRKRPAKEAFPERLRKARKAAKLTASVLSTAAGMGRGSVALMEAGKRTPRVGTVLRLAEVLGASPAALAFGDRRELGGEPDPDGLSERVQSARELRALTFHTLGMLAGSSYGQAQALESDADPSISTVERFAEALAVEASWLAFGLGDRDLKRDARRSTSGGLRPGVRIRG